MHLKSTTSRFNVLLSNFNSIKTKLFTTRFNVPFEWFQKSTLFRESVVDEICQLNIYKNSRISQLFYLITDAYQANNAPLKELRRFAYEIFSTFLIPNAPLQVMGITQVQIQVSLFFVYFENLLEYGYIVFCLN